MLSGNAEIQVKVQMGLCSTTLLQIPGRQPLLFFPSYPFLGETIPLVDRDEGTEEGGGQAKCLCGKPGMESTREECRATEWKEWNSESTRMGKIEGPGPGDLFLQSSSSSSPTGHLLMAQAPADSPGFEGVPEDPLQPSVWPCSPSR